MIFTCLLNVWCSSDHTIFVLYFAKNAPGKLFNDGAIINASTDAMFEQEGGKFPSQYFIATSPQHPVSYFMVQQSLNRLLGTKNIALQNTAVITGPGATKTGVVSNFCVFTCGRRFLWTLFARDGSLFVTSTFLSPSVLDVFHGRRIPNKRKLHWYS